MEIDDEYINIFPNNTILIVEDNEINIEVLHFLLHKTGISIDYAHDGKEALDMFGANPEKYDLVLMDIYMPNIDGFTATRKLRSMGDKGRDIPVIALTANASQKDMEMCFAAGMNEHVKKPINLKELITKMRQFLS